MSWVLHEPKGNFLYLEISMPGSECGFLYNSGHSQTRIQFSHGSHFETAKWLIGIKTPGWRAQVILLKGKLIMSIDYAGSASSTLYYFGEGWGPSWKSRRLGECIPLQSQVSTFSLEREQANDSTSAEGWGWYGPTTCNVTERFGLLFPRSVPEVLIWENGL